METWAALTRVCGQGVTLNWKLLVWGSVNYRRTETQRSDGRGFTQKQRSFEAEVFFLFLFDIIDMQHLYI